MADISAAQIKELREKTGAGFMDCKKALTEAEGDLLKAEEVLAKAGQKKVAKSASRTAAEGVIVTRADASKAVMLEVNCETDFVAKDASFNLFVESLLSAALSSDSDEMAAILALAGKEGSLEDDRKSLIAKIGENINPRRISRVKVQAGEHIGTYIHGTKIGAMVVIKGGDADLAKDLAMHVAAINPMYIDQKEVPAEILEKEKAIFIEIAKESGKPANIIEKMVDGRLNKYLSEICLVGQPFIKDPDKTINELLKAGNAEVVSFTRFLVGEGIEKAASNFAEEVMSQVKS